MSTLKDKLAAKRAKIEAKLAAKRRKLAEKIKEKFGGKS
jgi:hypothetical protein